LLISSVILFYCGIAFAYFVIFPILFGFFIGIAPEGVAVMTDIGQYLDFIIAIFLAFGIAFEVPVATFLLIAAGVTSVDKLANKRPYIIIGAFVVGMLLTPPDVISQSLLAIPIWLLFELGLIASRIFLKEKEGENVIMENDEFSLVEEPPVVHQPDVPEDDHDEEGRPLTDDEMEALFDEIEQEEADNKSKGDEDKGSDSGTGKNKPADK
jgi:sec-independent protein translocase protein TatC